MTKTVLIGSGSDLGTTIDGTRFGPKELLKKWEGKKIYLEQDSNIIKSKDPNDLRKNLQEVNKFNEKLYKTILNEKDFCITVGGDHSLGIASGFASLKKHQSLGVIWIDAHLDYNTFQTTITGNLHGLPLATLNGLNEDLRPFYNGNFFNPKNTVVVGYRAMEENALVEIENIKTMGVTVYTTKDIQEQGVKKIMDMAFKKALQDTKGLHISFDLDVIDPTLAMGVSVKEENGLNLEEVEEITSYIKKNRDNLKSFDLVEYNPKNDEDFKTLKIATDILKKITK